MLYNSQVRSLMEYSPLVWSSCPPSFLTLLDRVQNQARRLVEFKMRENDRPVYFQSLQHRRDVAALCVFYKVHQENNPHLATLRLQPEVPSTYNTRNSHSRSHELHVPFARTETFLRTFLPKYSRMWNQLVRETDLQLSTSLQQFKDSSTPVEAAPPGPCQSALGQFLSYANPCRSEGTITEYERPGSFVQPLTRPSSCTQYLWN
nr:uncharacterized protein LOC113820905 [Penaeus vannamei]